MKQILLNIIFGLIMAAAIGTIGYAISISNFNN